VIAACADPILAIARMKVQWPDVVVLDIEMPRMDGITFLKKIMAERPTPVVICSTLAEKGARRRWPRWRRARWPSSPNPSWA
jgi:two-component system chemotaxis response regulator CheB